MILLERQVRKFIKLCCVGFDVSVDGELSLKKGDTIEVFEKLERGWWRGE
jgi:hypothetical protein